MAGLMKIYRCEVCGNIVEVVHSGGGEPSCCNQKMTLLTENSVDASKEKHVPVIEKTGDGYRVTVGSVPHPMEADHYIEWIELIEQAADGSPVVVHRAHLKPGDKPEASFATKAARVGAREYCNKHGLWKA
jgi:superoxide reductase